MTNAEPPWVDGLTFAEVLADYELQDWLQIKALPRAFVLRTSSDGIYDVRVYGAHEQPLSGRPTDDEAYRVGGRLVLPL